jgi:hypothetical protein
MLLLAVSGLTTTFEKALKRFDILFLNVFIVCLIVRFCFRLCLVWLVKAMSKVSVVAFL